MIDNEGIIILLKARNCNWKKKYRNSGSAMVTVIVVAAFLTVIATTLLYVTAMNYRIKDAAYRNQRNFYEGETALEELRGRVTQDFTEACRDAYVQVMAQYAALGDEGNRTGKFRELLNQALKKKWNYDTLNTSDEWNAFLKGLVDAPYKGYISFRYPDPVPTGYKPYEYDDINGAIYLKDVALKYESEGCLTIIYTDICMDIPRLDFSLQKSESSLEGTDEEKQQKLLRQLIDASDYVNYSNWSKE